MKKAIYNIFFFSLIVSGLTGCLKGDTPNIDPNASTIVTMEYLAGGGGTTIGSGMTYFSGAALLYPATDEADTATFSVILGGGASINKDVSITIGVDANSLLDNFANDSIPYEAMPDSVYKLVSTTETISAGQKSAVFQIVFYPSKINTLKNYMLPITVTDASGYTVSSNFKKIYFHTIGNKIAGIYNWDFSRWDNATGAGSPRTDLSFTGDQTAFAPATPISIKVKTGYYTQPNYVISFDTTGGILSNFKVAFDATEFKADFTDNGLSLTSGPNLTVSADQKTFTIQYSVNNGSADRYLIDKYYKK